MSVAAGARGAVRVITIDRPEARNAFDDALIAELARSFEQADADAEVRVVVLAATGPVFSAGGDLTWMRRMASASREANLADARSLAGLLQTIDRCGKATIARVQGPAFGGALGLIAACDVAISAASAEFAASEVRLGLVPAVISPYVVRAVGVRAARRLFVTGTRVNAVEAQRIGLIHQVVAAEDLDRAIDETVDSLLAAGPNAIAATKRLLGKVAGTIGDDVTTATAEALADARATSEAEEGIAAFFAKRRPRWAE